MVGIYENIVAGKPCKLWRNKKICTCMENFPVLYWNTQVKQVFAAGRTKGAR